MSESFLPYGRHIVDEDDIAAVVSVLKGDWLTGGPVVAAFEQALAAQLGAPHVVACANGTAALHLAMLALGLKAGDVAVVPAMTFLATANAVRFVGGEVAFADVDPETGLLTAETFEDALKRARGPVKAVLPVHLNGHTVDLPSICSIAGARGIAVVEDACHAIGGSYGSADAPVGSCRSTAAATFSFHPVKTIAMGEGGAVSTRDPVLAERLARLRNHGMTKDAARFANVDLAFDGHGSPNPWYYEMLEIGFNYRASDINCALGLSQLQKLDRLLAARERLAAAYDARLKSLSNLVRPVARKSAGRSGWHLYAVQIDFAAAGIERARLMRELSRRGIGTQVHYVPVCHQPYYRDRYGPTAVPGADAYYRGALSLPLFPAMTEGDVERVVGVLAAVLELR